MAEEINMKKEMQAVPMVSPFPLPAPKNCSKPCPYGRGREYCWPCMAKLMQKEN